MNGWKNRWMRGSSGLLLAWILCWAGPAAAIDTGGADQVVREHEAYETCKVLARMYGFLRQTHEKLPRGHLDRKNAHQKYFEDGDFARGFPLRHFEKAAGVEVWCLHPEIREALVQDARVLDGLRPNGRQGRAIQVGMEELAAYEKPDAPGGTSLNPFSQAVREVRRRIRDVLRLMKKAKTDLLCGSSEGPPAKPDSLLGVPR